MKRRIAAVLLALCMCIGLLPATALAADQSSENGYFTLSYNNSGVIDNQITVNLYSPDGTQLDTLTVKDSRTTVQTITVSLADQYKDQYDVKYATVSGADDSVWNPKLDSYSVNISSYSSDGAVINVYLCDALNLPDGLIELSDDSSVTRIYRIYDDQLLKILHDNEILVTKDTEITGITPLWERSYSQDSTSFIRADREIDYWHLTVTSGNADVSEVQPTNMTGLQISYANGEDTGTVTVNTDDLRFLKGSEAEADEHYVIELNHDDFHIVYFYNAEGANTTHFTLYAVEFVDDGTSLGDRMPADPDYGTGNAYRFVNWEQNSYDGTGDPFFSNTIVTEDLTVFARKVSSSGIAGTEIHVINEEDQLLNRVVELYNADNSSSITASAIDKESVRIRVNGSSEDEHTNENYHANDWKDFQGTEYYLVHNYDLPIGIDATKNTHVGFDNISGIVVYFSLIGGEQGVSVEIPVGELAGDVAKSQDAQDNIIELRIISKPSAPTDEDLTDDPDDPDDTAILGEGAVTVDCINDDAGHGDKTYGLIANTEGQSDSYTIGEVEWRGTGDDAAYYVDITVQDDFYVEAYNQNDGVDVTHTITGDETKIITLKWVGDKWEVSSETPVTFTVTCEEDDPTEPDFDADDLAGVDVKVICVQNFTDHKYETTLKDAPSTAYTTNIESFEGSFGGVGVDWKCTVSIVTDVFVGLFNSEAADNSWGTHAFSYATPDKLVFYYTEASGWLCASDPTFTISVTEQKSQYTLTYDFNGGIYPQQDGTLLKKNSVTLAPGTYNLDKVAGYLEPVPNFDGQGEKVLFAGWTTEVPEEVGKVYHYDDPNIPEIEETVTITNRPVTVYAVWGYDEDQDGVADINEVIITPADITIYTGGTGYLGVTTNEDGDIVQTTESGLPQPGYHIGLPANIQTWLGGDGDAAAENLEDNLTFTYNGTDGEDGTTSREWGMSYAGIYALDEKDNPSRYVYTLNPSKDGNNEIPVRILYTDENGKPQEDDKIEMSQGAAHETYFMTINPGKLDQKLIQATLTKGNESKTLNVFIGTGTLTIRSVVEEDPTTAIANDAGKVNSNGITAVAGNNVDYYVNDSQVEITNLGDVKLLVDQVSNDDSFNGQMAEDAIAHVVDKVEGITDAKNLEHKMVYLDLVDTTNGNTVVKLGDGQAVDIYWPLPSGATAQENDTVHVVHYTDMNRESVETDLGDTVKEIIDGIVVQQNGQLYVKFSTSSFSPFVLVYEAKDTSTTDPDPDPDTDPNPGGGQDDSDPYLKFESNGGTKFDPIEADDSFHINVYDDDHYGSHIPTRPGYRFTGWYEDRNLTMRVDEDEELHVTGSKTVFAGWEETSVPSMLNGDDHYAYIQGYSDGTVRPNANITRAQVATIFFRLLDEDVRDDYLTTYNTFPDVNEDYWANTAISTMASLGVINGRNSGLFDPDAYITRAEFAAICARFDDSGVDGITTFTDTVGHWAEDEISRAAALGWIQGYADGTFRPNQYITRAQAVTMINRVLCRLPETEDDLLTGMNTWTDCHVTDWFYLAIQEATNSHDFVAKDRVYESWTDLNRDPDWSRYE